VKVVVLCRTDLFERLPGANKNKLRRDWSVVLDWYHDPRDPRASALMDLANLRAQVALGRPIDVVDRFFPPKIREGEIRKLVLDHTRHTPRDFGQLLGSTQRIAEASRTSRQHVLSREQIMSGLRDYSITYFLPEIRDELEGYFSAAEIDQIVGTLTAARAREFSFKDLKAAAAAVDAGALDLERVIRVLFGCSALGTIQTRTFNGRRSTRFTFEYRNRNSSVSMNERFFLHRGVWKALNLI